MNLRGVAVASLHLQVRKMLMLAVSTACLAMRTPLVLRRRHMLVGAPAAWSAATACHASDGYFFSGGKPVAREEAIKRILSRVPVFVVASKDGLPYLTETDSAGKQSGSIYIGLREAAEAADRVRVYDPAATVAVVPLASVYPLAAKTTAELEEQKTSLPQPSTGTSLDMRLFRLRPLDDESNAVGAEIASVPGTVPLYYAPELFLDVEGTQRRPYFFRLADLERTWARRPGAKAAAAAAKASGGDAELRARAVGLERLLAQMERGEARDEPILMPASETAELVKGRTLGNPVSQPREP